MNLRVSQEQASQAQQAAATQQRLLAQQQQIYGQISPFALSALNVGNEALAGNLNPALVNTYLQPAKSALTSSYDQARQNLIESLGSQGVYGSGIGGGAIGSLESRQARDIGTLTQQANAQAIQTALGMGTTGANILTGQQGVFNPSPYGNQAIGNAQAALVDPRQYARAGGGLLGSILGAGIGAVGSVLGKPPQK